MTKYNIKKNEIVQPFVGENEKYVGDRYWQSEKKNQYIFIQLHTMNIKANPLNLQDITTINKICIFIPISLKVLKVKMMKKIILQQIFS